MKKGRLLKMSRSRRAKKQSNLWAIVLVFVCVFVVGGTFYMLFDIKNKVKTINTIENANSNTVQNTIDNNILENEIVVQNTVNEVENSISTEIQNTANTVTKQVANTSKNTTIPNTTAIPAITDEKQKAIELVKKEWGDDDTVNFSFDYINEKGEYVVAVKDKASATVKNYFRVNLQNGTVELD